MIAVSLQKFWSKFVSARKAEDACSSSLVEKRIIVGLGNPGSKYVGTRHNAGFDVIDSIAESLQIVVKKKKFGSFFAELGFEDKKLILVKPQQYMNRSGQVVATVTGFYKSDLKEVLIITDDTALEPGQIRLRAEGGAGGHNGLVDIIAKLGTGAVSRLRIGIGKSEYQSGPDYVLGKPGAEQRKQMDKAIERATQAVFCWVNEGVEAAMNKFNARVEE